MGKWNIYLNHRTPLLYSTSANAITQSGRPLGFHRHATKPANRLMGTAK